MIMCMSVFCVSRALASTTTNDTTRNFVSRSQFRLNMVVVVCLQRKNSGEELPVPEGETAVGRGPFFKVTDKRVSRLHATLRLEDGKLALCPKHKNPCFFKGPEETSYKVLPKDNWKELVHGDSFSLLPDDLVFSVVYREKSKKEERIAVIQDDKILTVGDSTDFLDALFTTDDHKTTVSGYPSHKPIITDSKDDHNYETNLTVEVSSQHGSTGKSRILPSWLSGHNVTSQECVRKKADRKVRPRITVKKNNEDNSSPPIKKFARTATNPSSMIDDPSIYKEECKPEEIVVTSSVLPRKVSKEAKKKGVSKPVPVCPYGATCYRKNPVHFRQFSHDVSASLTSAIVDNVSSDDEKEYHKPICPFGKECYRKNSVHRQEYTHSDQMPKKKKENRRSKKGKCSILSGESDDDGEPNTYDYNDSFIDNSEEDGGDVSSFGSNSEDSDWSPCVKMTDSENVEELISETKSTKK
ncbi:aprataxin and PNK-like factor isoform X3 [Halichondria panicea]|uniref:aprataxin and PNK-like factor isoform X3 n=1 Tax=Halichondria panicea TaxID=6063 RepID=UPI00312B6923